MNVRFRALAVVMMASLAACGGDAVTPPPSPPAAPAVHDVYTIGDIFSPAFLDVAVGDSVRWNFAPGSDNDGHDVSFAAVTGRPPNIPVTKTGRVARRFTTKGTFPYDCFVHPGMRGEVTVR